MKPSARAGTGLDAPSPERGAAVVAGLTVASRGMGLVRTIVATSVAVALPSAGYRTVEPCTARIIARSSRAICEGPSSPIDTPACEPQRRRFARLMAAILTKS